MPSLSSNADVLTQSKVKLLLCGLRHFPQISLSELVFVFEYAFVSQCHCDVLSILKVIKDYFSPYDYVQEGGWMPTPFVIRLPFTILT